MTLEGRRIALLVENQYQEMEVWYPLYRLRDEGAEAVRDGNLITSGAPDDLPAFCRAIIDALKE